MQLEGGRIGEPGRFHNIGLSLLLFASLTLDSCSVGGPFGETCDAYDQSNPIARCAGFNGNGLTFGGSSGLVNPPVNGERYDAGITHWRTQSWKGGATTSIDFAKSIVAAAFDIHGSAVSIGYVEVNGARLSWHACSGEAMPWSPQIYLGSDFPTYGASDSLEFTYADFDGTSFSIKTPFAEFGKFTFPDTLVASKAYVVRYEKYFSQDSLVVQTNVGLNNGGLHDGRRIIVPDTGAIVFPPDFIQADSQGLYIVITRSHFESIISPQGKRIGVSTMQSTSDTLISVR